MAERAEADLVGALEVLEEFVGAQGGVVAGGAPDGGDFAPREGGQAVAPTGGRGPTAQELVHVEPFGRRFEAEVGPGSGPAVVLGGLGQASTGGLWRGLKVAYWPFTSIMKCEIASWQSPTATRWKWLDNQGVSGEVLSPPPQQRQQHQRGRR